jgi:hypothetical protein
MKIDYTAMHALDGYIACALVEAESGLTLSIDNKSTFEIEKASVYNGEVLKAKYRAIKALKLNDTIEDILITLTQQYHLIRPNKDGSKFFYLAIDRRLGNLAMARITLRNLAESIGL